MREQAKEGKMEGEERRERRDGIMGEMEDGVKILTLEEW